MRKPYPQEFCADVIARRREVGVTVKQIAADVRISESCPNNWAGRRRPRP